jgi:hypothetical protein
MSIIMTLSDEELEMYLSEEKKKSLKKIQQYYRKYGCEKTEILITYLESLCGTLTNIEEIDEIKKQIKILELYN